MASLLISDFLVALLNDSRLNGSEVDPLALRGGSCVCLLACGSVFNVEESPLSSISRSSMVLNDVEESRNDNEVS